MPRKDIQKEREDKLLSDSFLYKSPDDTGKVQEKDMKVKLPVNYIAALHSYKIVYGFTLRDMFVEALSDWFAKQRALEEKEKSKGN